MNIQAFITNISFPKTIEELEYFVMEVGRFNIDDVLLFETVEWTVPKWALVGDIVFFFHAKTAIQTIGKLERELKKNKEISDYNELMDGLKHAKELYDFFGGKIFAIGRVLGRPFYDDGDWQEEMHWKGRIYAEIGEICILDNPIEMESFSDFIMISRQSSITAVLGEDFEKLKKVISKSNIIIPSYLERGKANPMPLNKINEENWLILTQEYRRSFFLEIQFRKFYVDYLLQAIADKKKKFSECACYKNNRLVGYADNCIWLNGKIFFVEVKLSFDAERNFTNQLFKYSNVENVVLEKERRYYERIEQRYVLVIDTGRIGVFDAITKNISIITKLDLLKDKTDLSGLRHSLIEATKSRNTI